MGVQSLKSKLLTMKDQFYQGSSQKTLASNLS